MIPTGQDSLKTRSTLEVGGKSYAYFSLPKAAETLGEVDRLPFSMKVLLENLLRFEDGITVTRDDLQQDRSEPARMSQRAELPLENLTVDSQST